MRGGIIIDSREFERKLKRFAEASSKSLLEVTEDAGRRFVQNAIKNTRPLVLTSTPGQAKKAWKERVRSYLSSHRIVKMGSHKRYYRRDKDINKLMKQKEEKVGRAAAGWMRGAIILNAKRIPKWVSRHGAREGNFTKRRTRNGLSFTFVHSIPYNEDENYRCAVFAAEYTQRGFVRNFVAIKRKIKNAVK